MAAAGRLSRRRLKGASSAASVGIVTPPSSQNQTNVDSRDRRGNNADKVHMKDRCSCYSGSPGNAGNVCASHIGSPFYRIVHSISRVLAVLTACSALIDVAVAVTTTAIVLTLTVSVSESVKTALVEMPDVVNLPEWR